MALTTNDLIPFSSGLANLGVNGSEGGAFDASSITPFGNIHFVSGVIHDPILGQSGILRYNRAAGDDGAIEFSLDGGASFRRFAGETLQSAYENGQEITIDRVALANLVFTAEAGRTVLMGNGTYAPLNIDPFLKSPDVQPRVGDLWMLAHSLIVSGVAASVSTNAISQARSLGIGTLGLNTGSGYINLSVGSGIGQFSASAAQAIPTGGGAVIPFDTVDFGDANYMNDGTDTITILTPGLYKIHYNCSYDNTVSTSRHIIETDILKNVSPHRPSSAYSYHRNTAHGEGTASATVLAECNAGDTINLRARYAGTATTNAVSSIADECWILIEKIGPKRGR